MLAPARMQRPGALPGVGASDPVCPFCEGSEGETPPEVLAYGRDGTAPDGPGWAVRVVPNRYPAFPGQEVVVHGPRHVASFADLDPRLATLVVDAWAARARAHAAAGAASLLCAINEGGAAGASLAHSHSQLVPFDEVPPRIADEVPPLAADCALCRALPAERRRAWRDADGLLTFCPSWSAFPYEAWVAPAEHRADAFAEPSAPLAGAILDAAQRLRTLLGSGLAWNAWLHTEPFGGGGFHWHLEIAPRLTALAAVELGAGVAVNIVDPDTAAEALGAAQPASSRARPAR